MKMKNSDDDSDDDKEMISTDDSLQSMTDLVLESLKEEYKIEWEPFDLYAQRLRSHVHSNTQQFREKFKKGYETLLERMKDEGGRMK